MTTAVGKLKVWKPPEESECGRMEPGVAKNNSVVQIMWHSADILNLLPLKTPQCFEKQALRLNVLVFGDQPGPLAFWGCHFVQQHPCSSLLVW